MEWPTMTIHECCEALRANRVPASERVVGQMIREGRLPFAVGTQLEGRGRSVYMIFRFPFYQWLDGNLGHKAIRIQEET